MNKGLAENQPLGDLSFKILAEWTYSFSFVEFIDY